MPCWHRAETSANAILERWPRNRTWVVPLGMAFRTTASAKLLPSTSLVFSLGCLSMNSDPLLLSSSLCPKIAFSNYFSLNGNKSLKMIKIQELAWLSRPRLRTLAPRFSASSMASSIKPLMALACHLREYYHVNNNPLQLIRTCT